VVDVANVMGARPDGWWRDRVGAALRLCRDVARLAASGVPAERMPAGLSAPGVWVLVLEGRARQAGPLLADMTPSVRVVSAPGSGDDAIVAEAAVDSVDGGACLVVTADRELRRRCEELGAVVVGPGWLLGLL